MIETKETFKNVPDQNDNSITGLEKINKSLLNIFFR